MTRRTFDDDQVFVVGMYDQVLAREPDLDGFWANVRALWDGAGRDVVLLGVLRSDEAVGKGADEETWARQGIDSAVVLVHGLLVCLGLPELEGPRHDQLVARARLGVPAAVLAFELAPARVPEPWERILVRELLRGVPGGTDPDRVDLALVRVARREALHAILAAHLPGRGLRTAVRRHRAAARAVEYAGFVQRSRPVHDESAQAPVWQLGDRVMGEMQAVTSEIGSLALRLAAIEQTIEDRREPGPGRR